MLNYLKKETEEEKRKKRRTNIRYANRKWILVLSSYIKLSAVLLLHFFFFFFNKLSLFFVAIAALHKYWMGLNKIDSCPVAPVIQLKSIVRITTSIELEPGKQCRTLLTSMERDSFTMKCMCKMTTANCITILVGSVTQMERKVSLEFHKAIQMWPAMAQQEVCSWRRTLQLPFK